MNRTGYFERIVCDISISNTIVYYAHGNITCNELVKGICCLIR
jgi:hypothetical protein